MTSRHAKLPEKRAGGVCLPCPRNVPQERMSVPRGRMNAPQGRMNTPRGRMNTPRGRMNAPRERMNAPRERMNAPQERMNAPQRRTNVPARRLDAPGRRTSTPRAAGFTGNIGPECPGTGESSSIETVGGGWGDSRVPFQRRRDTIKTRILGVATLGAAILLVLSWPGTARRHSGGRRPDPALT
jgi:hypothetical protein